MEETLDKQPEISAPAGTSNNSNNNNNNNNNNKEALHAATMSAMVSTVVVPASSETETKIVIDSTTIINDVTKVAVGNSVDMVAGKDQYSDKVPDPKHEKCDHDDDDDEEEEEDNKDKDNQEWTNHGDPLPPVASTPPMLQSPPRPPKVEFLPQDQQQQQQQQQYPSYQHKGQPLRPKQARQKWTDTNSDKHCLEQTQNPLSRLAYSISLATGYYAIEPMDKRLSLFFGYALLLIFIVLIYVFYHGIQDGMKEAAAAAAAQLLTTTIVGEAGEHVVTDGNSGVMLYGDDAVNNNNNHVPLSPPASASGDL